MDQRDTVMATLAPSPAILYSSSLFLLVLHSVCNYLVFTIVLPFLLSTQLQALTLTELLSGWFVFNQATCLQGLISQFDSRMNTIKILKYMQTLDGHMQN